MDVQLVTIAKQSLTSQSHSILVTIVEQAKLKQKGCSTCKHS
jgi:hypothetical protein